MTRTNHRAYGSWILGTFLLLFVFAVFWLAPDSLPSFKQQILALSMALLAGLFGFFLTGDMALAMSHNVSSTSLKATGGIALFVLVLGWWNSPATPVIAEETLTVPAKITETSRDSSIHTSEDAKIRAAEDGEVNVITGSGQVLQGKQAKDEAKEQPAASSNSSISSDGDLVIEATGNGKVNVLTGNGQVQQAE